MPGLKIPEIGLTLTPYWHAMAVLRTWPRVITLGGGLLGHLSL